MIIPNLKSSTAREEKRELIKDLKEALALTREIDRQADCINAIVLRQHSQHMLAA